MTTAQFVATEFAAKSGEAVKSGPIGFAVILLLCVACYFLFKSMSKHLKKVREEFPADEPRPPQARATTPDEPGTTVPADGTGTAITEPRDTP